MMRMHSRSWRLVVSLWLSLGLGLVALGCDAPAAPADAAQSDAGQGDAALDPDAATPDASRPDAGTDARVVLPGTHIAWVNYGWPVDLTPDGATAAIQDLASTDGDLYLYDVAAGTLTLVTTVGDPTQDFATGISSTGRVSALHGVPIRAGSWTMADGWHDEPDPFATGCDANRAGAWDVSADGNVLVGLGWDGCYPQAYRWTRDSGGASTATALERIGSTASGTAVPVNRASVISDDGTVIAGFAETDMVDRWPAVWHADGSGVLLPGTILDAPGEVLSISADGSVLAGIWNLEGFRWTQADGVVSLGTLPGSLGGDSTYPNAIAADGALIFGGSGGFGGTTAFVWTASEGMRPLGDLLVAAGITLAPGVVLTNVLAASTDGTVLLGTAMDAFGATMTFVAEAPVAAYGL